LEQRFIEHLDNEIHFSLLRARYHFQLKYTPGKNSDKRKIHLFLADEFMIMNNVLDNEQGFYFDQNRIILGSEFQFSQVSSLSLSYIHWYQYRYTRRETDYFHSRHILRITLHQQF